MNKYGEKVSEKGVVRAGKRFILSISKEDMNDITKIRKSLEEWVYELIKLLKQ